LRLHPGFGTLEFRVPDAQSSVTDAAAVVAVVQALVAWLAEQQESGAPLPVHPTWRIEENRWLACRDGVEGHMADLQTGRLDSTRARLEELLTELRPYGERFQSQHALAHAGAMTQRNGAITQRHVAKQSDTTALARWLAEQFLC
jgi:carboxylate-amine ligase